MAEEMIVKELDEVVVRFAENISRFILFFYGTSPFLPKLIL